MSRPDALHGAGRPREYSRRNLRALSDYLDATENEVAVDGLFFRMYGLQPSDVGRLPRPATWCKAAAKARRTSRLVAHLSRLVWLCGGGSLFHARQAGKLEQHCTATTSTASSTTPLRGEYVLGLTARAADVAKAVLPRNPDRQWVTVPWVATDIRPDQGRELPLLSLVSRSELAEALRLARAAQRLFGKRTNLHSWELQTYTALRWFLVRTALMKLHGHFIMTEHYDRWAVLVDGVVAEHRRCGRRTQLTLIQHGLIETDSYTGLDTGFQIALSRRLHEVTSLFTYNRASETVFKAHVLGPQSNSSHLTVAYFTPRLEVSSFPSTHACRILFVGHPVCERLHVHLYNAVVSRFPVAAYYKPHPAAAMSQEMATVGWTVVTQANQFPEIDFLISYPSTLVAEYAALGREAVVHAIDLSPSSASSVEMQIGQKLGEILSPETVNSTASVSTSERSNP